MELGHGDYTENGIEVCWDVDAVRRSGRDRRVVDAIDTTGDAAGVRFSAIGQVIGPPIQRSSRARGTRNCLPRRMTGIPLDPSVARYSRASSYALLLPIRRTAAASSTVRKSGALSSRNSRLALTLATCLSKRSFVTLPWSSALRFLDRCLGIGSSPEYRAQEAPSAATFVEDDVRGSRRAVGCCQLVLAGVALCGHHIVNTC